MSFAGAQRWAARGTCPRGGHQEIRLYARVLLRRGTLERLLAAGVDPAWYPELGIRAAQIAAAKTRRALSLSLEAALRSAHRAPQWTAAATITRFALRHASRIERSSAQLIQPSTHSDVGRKETASATLGLARRAISRTEPRNQMVGRMTRLSARVSVAAIKRAGASTECP